VRSPLAPCLLAAILLLPATRGVSAGILLEAEMGGTPLTVEVSNDPTRALATVAGRRYFVDLEPGEIRALDGPAPDRREPAALSAPVPAPSSSLERWSEGPVVADHGSTYHVLIVGERICAEVLASPWMTGFTRPLVQTLELLQRAEPRLAPGPHGPCPPVGFGAYAADGFPLLVGYKGEPLFRVTRLRFDHRPAAGDLAPPADAGGCGRKSC
jgi:hypothetical protein